MRKTWSVKLLYHNLVGLVMNLCATLHGIDIEIVDNQMINVFLFKLFFCLPVVVISLLMTLTPVELRAQKVENIKKNIRGDTVILVYDLISQHPDVNYEIRLYGITGAHRQRLFRAQGDVGRNIRAGFDKQISWIRNVELLGHDISTINFELSATFLNPLVEFSFPVGKPQVKRDEVYDLNWLGGENVRLYLMQDRKRVMNIGYAKNRGSFTWQVPMNIKPGKGYRIRLENENDPSSFLLSEPFTIRRKIPTALKAIPFVGVAALILIVNGGDSDGDSELPGPIDPN